MNKGKQVKSISVAPSAEYCIWVIPTDDLAYDTTVTVAPGCQMLYIVNGQLRERVQSRTVLINPKKEKKFTQNITLVGVNFEKTFDILCGVGKVPYKDNELGADTVVGVSADMKVRVSDAWKLFTMLGNRSVKGEEINDFVRGKCAEILSTELSHKLQSCTYHTLTAEKEKMSAALEEKIAAVLQDMGLFLVPSSFALGDFFFQPDYIQLRQDYGKQQAGIQMEKEILKLERQKTRMDLDAAGEIARINAQNAQTQANAKAYCPNCGIEVPPGTKFCPKCGRKV